MDKALVRAGVVCCWTLCVCLTTVAYSGDAIAANVEKGWAIQFYRDTFTKDIFPIASVDESQSTTPSSLDLVCGKSNVAFGAHMATISGLGLFFPLDRNKGQPDSLGVLFRTDKAQAAIKFMYNTEHTGVEFVASPAETKKLVALFAENPKGDVAFRVTDTSKGFQPISTQGAFPAAGFETALSIMSTYCTK